MPWALSLNKEKLTVITVKKKHRDDFVISLQELPNTSKVVKRFYNQSLLSFVIPFIPHQVLPPLKTHQSEIFVPLTHPSDIKRAWNSYLPSEISSKFFIHKWEVISSEEKGSWIRVFSIKSNPESNLYSKFIPHSIAMQGLCSLFSTPTKTLLHLFHFDKNLVYLTTIKDGVICNFSYSPHLEGIQGQLNALCSKPLKGAFYCTGSVTAADTHHILSINPKITKASPKSFRGIMESELVYYGAEIGAALSGCSRQKGKPLIFFTPSVPIKTSITQFLRPIIFLYCFTILTCTSFLFYSYKLYQIDRSELKQAYYNLHKSLADASPPSLDSFTKEELTDYLIDLTKSSSAKKLPYRVAPTTPEVRELLDWLLSYPIDNLYLEDFTYKLTEAPSSKNPSKSYSARVSLEVSSTSPETASEFIKNLVEASGFVCKTKPMQWRSSGNHYTASFYLSPKKGER